MFSEWGPACQEGSCEGGSFLTLGDLLIGVFRREPRNSSEECNRCSRGKTEKIHPKGHCLTALSSQETSHMLTPKASGVWVPRLRLWGSDDREKTRVGCHKGTLRKLV